MWNSKMDEEFQRREEEEREKRRRIMSITFSSSSPPSSPPMKKSTGSIIKKKKNAMLKVPRNFALPFQSGTQFSPKLQQACDTIVAHAHEVKDVLSGDVLQSLVNIRDAMSKEEQENPQVILRYTVPGTSWYMKEVIGICEYWVGVFFNVSFTCDLDGTDETLVSVNCKEVTDVRPFYGEGTTKLDHVGPLGYKKAVDEFIVKKGQEFRDTLDDIIHAAGIRTSQEVIKQLDLFRKPIKRLSKGKSIYYGGTAEKDN